MKRIIVVLMAVVLACLACQPKERAMAIDFTDGQYIDFGHKAAIDNLTQMSFITFIELDALNASGFPNIIALKESDSSPTGWAFEVYGASENYLKFSYKFSTKAGIWRTAKVWSTGTLYCVAVTYDRSSTSNDPVLYIDGVAGSLTEVLTPAGAPADNSGYDLTIGNYDGLAAGFSLNGKMYKAIMYSDILTATEVKNFCDSRGKIYPRDNIAFMPMLKGAAGLSTFDGATLAAGNAIYDPYSQTYGVPVGSPIAVADNKLGW